jgi:molecular chaperone GrpE (heat shock protein)
MAFENFKWFQGRKKEKEEAQRLVMEELQGLKKLLRKQSVLIEEVRREQDAHRERESRKTEPLMELCDSIFYLHKSFQSPGLMSRQHAQVLNMVLSRLDRFSASLGMEMILAEGVPFDSRIHEAIDNRDPGSQSLQIIEVVSPGYLQNGKVLRAARVIVGAADNSGSASGGD